MHRRTPPALVRGRGHAACCSPIECDALPPGARQDRATDVSRVRGLPPGAELYRLEVVWTPKGQHHPHSIYGPRKLARDSPTQPIQVKPRSARERLHIDQWLKKRDGRPYMRLPPSHSRRPHRAFPLAGLQLLANAEV